MRFFNALSVFLLLSLASARIVQDDHPEHQARRLIRRASKDRIPNQYIVKLSESAKPTELLSALIGRNPYSSIMHQYSNHAFRGFAVSGITGSALLDLAQSHPNSIVEIEEDAEVYAHEEDELIWNLDRLDSRSGELDNLFETEYTGQGINIYILDTGVRGSHVEFEGRVLPGMDFSSDRDNIDGNGHGTHVAATAAGKTYGVAKKANIVPVKVLTAGGSGTISGVVAGIDWVAGNNKEGSSSVANLSLGGGFSSLLNDAVRAAVEAGVIMVVSAGNNNGNACDSSPASEEFAITVGSTTGDPYMDTRSYFSNYGSCVDIFAPGSSIKSAWSSSDNATNTISGTSMSSPHVAGAAALLLESESVKDPDQQVDVVSRILDLSTPDVITDPGADSPNRMLYIPSPNDSPPDDDPADDDPEDDPPADDPEDDPPADDPEDPPTETEPKPLGARARRRHTRIAMTLVYDNSPSETRVELHRRNRRSEGFVWSQEGIWEAPSLEVASSTPLEPLVITRDLPNGHYAYTIFDSNANGLCCTNGKGSFTLSEITPGVMVRGERADNEENVFATGGEFQSSISIEFEVHNGQVLTTTILEE